MYPAEFGGKASALINVITKSGTSRFRGGALEFVRNSAPGFATVDLGLQKDIALAHGARLQFRWNRNLQSADPRELRRPEPHCIYAELRTHLQREAAAAKLQFGVKLTF